VAMLAIGGLGAGYALTGSGASILRRRLRHG
jgi:hypothetical protein